MPKPNLKLVGLLPKPNQAVTDALALGPKTAVLNCRLWCCRHIILVIREQQNTSPGLKGLSN